MIINCLADFFYREIYFLKLETCDVSLNILVREVYDCISNSRDWA